MLDPIIRPLFAALCLAGPTMSAPAQSTSAPTQDPTQELVVGEIVEAELTADEEHVYLIRAQAGDRVEGTLLQQEGDVQLIVTNKAERALPTFDYAPDGYEPFRFRAASAGEYRVAVSAVDGAASRYALHLGLCEPEGSTSLERAHQAMDALPPFADGLAVLYHDGAAVGFARAEGRIPDGPFGSFTLDTPIVAEEFELQLAGYAICLLVEEGAIKLDAAVREAAQLPHLDPRLTIEHVLDGESGLRGLRELDYFCTGIRSRPGRERMTTLLEAQRDLNFTPGERHDNSGTRATRSLVLQRVVEQATTEPYARWMHGRVFEPLGLRGASIGLVTTELGLAKVEHLVPRMSPNDILRWLDATRSPTAVFAEWRGYFGSALGGMSTGLEPDVHKLAGSGHDFQTIGIRLKGPLVPLMYARDVHDVLVGYPWELEHPGRRSTSTGRYGPRTGRYQATVSFDPMTKRGLMGTYRAVEFDLEFVAGDLGDGSICLFLPGGRLIDMEPTTRPGRLIGGPGQSWSLEFDPDETGVGRVIRLTPGAAELERLAFVLEEPAFE